NERRQNALFILHLPGSVFWSQVHLRRLQNKRRSGGRRRARGRRRHPRERRRRCFLLL
ncbi:hypothetical protein AVEN_273115-2-1, partial [Araneus ventricosus]